MINYPSPQDYNEALQMPHLTLLDPQLAQGQVEVDSLGLPFGRTGAFAITFKVSAQRRDFAFRCFLQNRPTIHERYDGISDFLGNRPLPYFVDYRYLDSGIRVNGNEFPCLQMSWANGVPLGVYVDKNHQDQGRMTALQQQIQGLALALEVAGVAHGDIQGGNLLIGSGGEIKLVDYDGMFVPSLKAFGALENGHPNFQHPMRAKVQPFDATLDRFSFALLHTVLGALIEDPSLWIRLKADPDKFLLGEADFANPYTSSGFLELEKLSRSGESARALQAVASSAFESVPSFTDFLVGRNIPAGVRPKNQSSGSTAARRIGPEVPWYLATSTMLEAGVRGDGSLGHYLARNTVIGPNDVSAWTNRNVQVEIVGKVQDVETGESGTGLKFVKLLMNEGDPRLSINIWAAGLEDLKAAGAHIDESWRGNWISATGVIEGPLGSLHGTSYSMTVAKASQLELVTPQQARWRLQTAMPHKGVEDTSSSEASSNAEAVATLTGTRSASASSVPSYGSTPQTTGGQPTQKSFLSTGLGLFVLIFGIVGVLVVLVIAGAGGFSSSGSSGDGDGSDSSVAAEVKVGDCVSGGIGNRTVVDCEDPGATLKIERFEPVGPGCPPGRGVRTEVIVDRAVCLVPLRPDLSLVALGECLEGASGVATSCIAGESWKVVSRVQSRGLCPVASLVIPIANETGTFICAVPFLGDPVYRTCVSGEYTVDGSFEDCFNELRWTYGGCWEFGEGAVLQQFLGGKWETVKRDITIGKTSNCPEDFPWEIEFSRKASSVGVKQYRILVPKTGDIQDLDVTVTELGAN